MRACFQTDFHGDFHNVNVYVAHEGFTTFGWETCRFVSVDELQQEAADTVVVGGISVIQRRLGQLGITTPLNQRDYPAELAPYLGRNVWESTIEEVAANPDHWGIFVKPRDDLKRFTGKVVRRYSDFIGLIDETRSTPIWCSELVQFVTEWRCFVRYGRILDIRQYRGAWTSKLDLMTVEAAIADFRSAPAAYALDFGITEQGEMKLVEVNDGFSLGTYGLSAVNYAKLLAARWAELTGTPDHANF